MYWRVFSVIVVVIVEAFVGDFRFIQVVRVDRSIMGMTVVKVIT
jgi:hypothetical protein